MLLDYEIAHCSRVCAVTGRTLGPGETYFSTLQLENGAPVRRDVAAEAWTTPPDGLVAWWKSRMADADGLRPKLAPQDVLLNLFVELAGNEAEREFRYVLGLLLIRRRIVRLDETRRRGDAEVMILECSRRGEQYELAVATPDAERTVALERRLVELLYGGA
jgi:hypothetical protein